jgi:hypothetical protein
MNDRERERGCESEEEEKDKVTTDRERGDVRMSSV